jgi:hypothetical protein
MIAPQKHCGCVAKVIEPPSMAKEVKEMISLRVGYQSTRLKVLEQMVRVCRLVLLTLV